MQKTGFVQGRSFKKMFDSLQDGIVVLNNGKLKFMNDLSNRILSEICGLKSFFLNTNAEGKTQEADQLDKKVFFIF